MSECDYCGRRHLKGLRNYPASVKANAKCGKSNHFAVKCRSKISQQTRSRDYVNFTDVAENADFDVTTVTHTINGVQDLEGHAQRKRLLSRMTVNEQFSIVFQIDTGATCNILPMEGLPPPLIIDRSEKLNLQFFNISQTTTLGTCTLNLSHGSEPRTYLIKLHVVDNGAASLLGVQASMEMGLIEEKTESVYWLQADEVKLHQVAQIIFKKILHKSSNPK